MGIQKTTFCAHCAKNILSNWKGWPHRDVIPLIPVLQKGKCKLCGNSDLIANSQISWFNYHGPFNTGLPDYWQLLINDSRRNWGKPYLAQSTCPKCQTDAIFSEMIPPSKKGEYRFSCDGCGIVKPTINTKGKDALRQAYESTEFIATSENSEVLSIHINEHAPALDHILQQNNVQQWVFITACNPYSVELSDTDNIERNQRLFNTLKEQYIVYGGQGVPENDNWEPEPSYLVLGMNRSEGVKIGREFQQNAIVTGEIQKPAQLVWMR